MPSLQRPMYVDVRETYMLDTKTKTWKECVNKKAFAVGRIHTVPHTAGDIFYWKMLLNHEDMLTLPSGIRCETYKHVCEDLGLLQDNGEYRYVLSECVLTMTSRTFE